MKKKKKEKKPSLVDQLLPKASILKIYQTRPNVLVEIEVRYAGTLHTGFAFSKVRWPDKWNLEEGIQIAKRKALIGIVRDQVKGAGK